MGCGCGRNRKNLISSRLDRKRKSNIPLSSLSKKTTMKRLLKCKECPYSSKTTIGSRCKKANRLISKIISDRNFKCPLGLY